jgi:hypothetical protein
LRHHALLLAGRDKPACDASGSAMILMVPKARPRF